MPISRNLSPRIGTVGMTDPQPMTKPRIRFLRYWFNPARSRNEPVYRYIYDDLAAVEEWERCNPPRGKPPEDNRTTS